ncbi:helix-turn-helix domain-containing protein [Microtetraspora sp. NBRC 16547]|uniref:winged helix-turn-helix domain-containing protein n=1 Tax=Microtetraspora sp. NBRC 16547 TaxID=3030993 RepID=UPI0024A568D9|nr:helix-turn-helix domain-containing protein [Microtetraspora sp. NBRC 16547]GLW98559.1 transcriptional regulator [Microtetraspora sp. NBRC 16547]
MTEIQRRQLSDPEALKALAHPLRQRLLTHLQRYGPATSATLAAEFDEDRGATSYHLRQLSRFGFIEVDVDRSAGRRKFWRAIPLDLRLPSRAVNAEAEAAATEIDRQWQEHGERELAAFLANEDDFGPFGDAALSSIGGTTLTAAELAAFTEEYVALLTRWRREPDQAPDGARHITVIFHAFPTPRSSEAR